MTIESKIQNINAVHLSDTKSYYGDKHDALPLLVIDSALCKATICLQGAHLIEFSAKGRAPLLWVSPKVAYKQGKAIRGGVPICFPWFGENQLDKSQPSHGFVRNRSWHLERAQQFTDGRIALTFSTQSDADTLGLFPFAFATEFQVILGQKIELKLATQNHSDQVMPISFALHSYHPVSALAEAKVQGLDLTTYLDNTCQYQAHIQQGDVVFNGEVDRIYLNVASEQIIQTQTPIALKSDSCRSAIVWNPAAEKAASMGDLGEENYPSFVCVERGNAFSDSWYLAPGEIKQAELVIDYA
ncbi:aldose 1-epimerase family protein [Catenovulum agarivorans DS-2]|uniref:Putative glucose-6-phosphate 1-epimerase n=1 Tax=Catenovulum agarivorans DS-2 TaxID=1328313 RepID=W7QJU2_9ALTE|nr:D-hexose-6-phosphate mutarotase [Catenovulum agarivorans]EWH12156.1 aldose 1-epimerase family protein [Catenovulum agarivorans DS-2]